jgi:threonine dehydrogenase-like Zn-dependent dehydrogenase
MGKKMIDLEKIVTHEFGIDQWEKAFDLLETRNAVKVVLKPI